MTRTPARLSPGAWTWVLVAVGVVIRLIHWLRDPVIWGDETALVLNVLDLDFRGFFGPLEHFVPAPPLFLVLERLGMLALGDSTLALRVPTLLAGCASLVLFALAVRRVLPDWPAVLAVGLFSVSDRMIWHATEAKPYAVDVFVSCLVLWGYIRTRDLPLTWQCGLWALVLPVAEWLSYPSCFVAGGLMLALLPAAWRGGWAGRLAYVGLGLAVVGSFVALALGPVAAQQHAEINNCWVNDLPDWSRPARLPKWAAGGTLEIVEYALVPLGHLLLPVALVGAVRLRRTDVRLLTLLVAPVGLTLVAALLGRYPYGGGRVGSFLVPAVILLIAAGVPATWAWLRARSRFAPLALAGLLAVPFAYAPYRIAVPIPRADFKSAVEYVESARRPDDLVVNEYWEALYYTRRWPDQKDRVCRINELADRPANRLWVLTAVNRGAANGVQDLIPAGWRLVEVRTFPRTAVILYERVPESPAPVSTGRRESP